MRFDFAKFWKTCTGYWYAWFSVCSIVVFWLFYLRFVRCEIRLEGLEGGRGPFCSFLRLDLWNFAVCTEVTETEKTPPRPCCRARRDAWNEVRHGTSEARPSKDTRARRRFITKISGVKDIPAEW